MAEAVEFPEMNYRLGQPKGVSEDQVRTLRTHRAEYPDGSSLHISCWRLNADELAEVARTGLVWLYVMGDAHPPVHVNGGTPFEASVLASAQAHIAHVRACSSPIGCVECCEAQAFLIVHGEKPSEASP